MSKAVVKNSSKKTPSVPAPEPVRLITTVAPELLDLPHFRMLVEMLTFRRPAFSKTEEAFIARFILPTGAEPDAYGNYWLVVGDDTPTIMFSSHTDTVHCVGGRQAIFFDKNEITLYDPNDKNADCLGADCTTGVWLMLQMIEAGVPGLYVFHRDEECGCKGSRYVEEHLAESLVGIQAAIAFDRKGIEDVITHQCAHRCASDTFAWSLAKLLPKGNKPSPEGIVTDTELYSEIIPECTNVSVGYYNQHTPNELQSVPYALKLRDHLIKADWTTLMIERNPAVTEYKSYGRYSNYLSTTYGGTEVYEQDAELYELEEFVRSRPVTTAKFLRSMGYDLDDLLYELRNNKLTY